MSDPATKRPKMDAESGSGTQRKSTSPKQPSDRCTQRFAEIVGTAEFIDKTLFVKVFLENRASMIVVLAPQKFGKSTNMDMVRQFVSGNEKLFKDNKLKIYEEERDFFDKNCKAKEPNPVIHVHFRRVGGETKDAVLESLRGVIGDAYYDNQDLVTEDCKGNWTWTNNKKMEKPPRITAKKFTQYWENPENLSENDVIYGLRRLSECLQLHYDKPVYVFIDEYDYPIMEAIMNETKNEVVSRTIWLIRGMMYDLLKGNDYVKKALINACGRIAEVFSANNIVHYEFLENSSFAPYFGFTVQEVQALFKRDEFVTFRNDDDIRKWYNGYKSIDTNEYVIYSPFSILNYLRESRKNNKQTFKNYWFNSGYIKNLKELFTNTGIREHIENLIQGEEVEINTVDKINEDDIFALKSLIHDEPKPASADLFLQFLSQNGYFNVVQRIEDPGPTATLTVPNKEIKRVLEQACYDADFFQTKYKLDVQKIVAYQNAFISLLERRDDNVFLSFAKAVSELFIGVEMPQNENEFQCIIYVFVYNLKSFVAHSELDTRKLKGRGILDILVVWRHMGLIMELKFKSETSEKAHDQIKTQKYDATFKDDKYKNVTQKTFVGVHMAEDRTVNVTRSFDNDSKIKTFTSKGEVINVE